MSEPTQDPTPDAPGQDGEQEDGREGTAFVQVNRRRAPRFRSFALTGLVIAFVLAGGIAVVTPPSDGYSQQALFGYLFCAFGLVFVLLGALVAVLADRRTGTRPEPRRPRGKRSGV